MGKVKQLLTEMQLQDKNLQYINHVFDKLYKNKERKDNDKT